MTSSHDDLTISDLAHKDVVAIRRAFYRGLSWTCLKTAWREINAVREEKHEYLGKRLERKGVSQQKIATALDRSAGEICRWLHGKSPEWANLMVVMLAVDVETVESDDWFAGACIPSRAAIEQLSAGTGIRKALTPTLSPAAGARELGATGWRPVPRP